MTRPARIAMAVLGTTVVATATVGGSALIAALDGPLWSVAAVIAVGMGALAGLGCALTEPGRNPWREREARENGYPYDGGSCHAAARSCLDGPEVRITHPDGGPTDLFADQDRRAL
jgi:hypothetical protein